MDHNFAPKTLTVDQNGSYPSIGQPSSYLHFAADVGALGYLNLLAEQSCQAYDTGTNDKKADKLCDIDVRHYEDKLFVRGPPSIRHTKNRGAAMGMLRAHLLDRQRDTAPKLQVPRPEVPLFNGQVRTYMLKSP
jgi:hypothetical protein